MPEPGQEPKQGRKEPEQEQEQQQGRKEHYL